MIPHFPEFKPIELSDKEDVEKFTKPYPPYSDFNFVSMWSWDVKGEMALSQLNDNLVVKFTDYLTGDPFYTFIGTSSLEETVERLFQKTEEENLDEKLRLIPQITTDSFLKKNSRYIISEDMDNFDYVYDIEALIDFPGSALKTQRNMVTHFLKKYPNYKVKKISLAEEEGQNAILKLYKVWQENNGHFVPHELQALQKCLAGAHVLNIFGLGIFIDDQLIGFSINEVDTHEYINCFFAKGNIKYYGIYAVLMNETVKFLKNEKLGKYINYEQDLGLFNLRKAKKAFNPCFFLRKSSIRPLDTL